LTKDKKNSSTRLVVILPVGEDAAIQKVAIDDETVFQRQLRIALTGLHA
jgi:hypothetical protein